MMMEALLDMAEPAAGKPGGVKGGVAESSLDKEGEERRDKINPDCGCGTDVVNNSFKVEYGDVAHTNKTDDEEKGKPSESPSQNSR
jgi:hypothetical protein